MCAAQPRSSKGMANVKLILIASIVSLAIQTSAASASCGDYVSRKGTFTRKDATNRTTSAPGSLPKLGEHKPAAPWNRPIPCTGPLCSGGGLPPMAPVSSSLAENDQWAWEMTWPHESFADPNLFSFTCEEKHSDHKASEIFHPPRTISF